MYVVTYETFLLLAYTTKQQFISLHLLAYITKRSSIHTRHTHNCDLFHIPLYRTANGQHTFAYRGTTIWSNLDSDIK